MEDPIIIANDMSGSVSESSLDESVYNRIDYHVNGSTVTALFPVNNKDNEILSLVQNTLVQSYINNIGIKKDSVEKE